VTARTPAAGWVFGLALLLATSFAQAATDTPADGPAAPLHERVLRLSGDNSRSPALLEVTLYTPDGPGPFPLAVMNHGAAQPGQTPAAMPRYRASFEAYYFLSRGYAVAMPMLRGFAGSEGRIEPQGCNAAQFGLDNAKDVAAVMAALGREPEIDSSRVVVAGQSAGGWNTLALGTIAGPAVKGLVSFAGGVRESDCRDQDRALLDGAETFGRLTRIPSIWFYGDNDSLFAPALWRAMYQRYTAAGGPAQLVAYGRFGADSHKLAASPDSLRIWTPQLDAFLGRIGLPHAPLYPNYLPPPPPPPSHFAALEDVAAVPYLNEPGRALYRAFLSLPSPRAFILSSQTASSQSGGFDPINRAMKSCAATSIGPCAVYAYDDYVAWTPPKSAPVVSRDYHLTVAAGSTATLNFSSAVNPDCSLLGLPKDWVSRTPAHGLAFAVRRDDFPRFPPTNPLAVCNRTRVPGMAITYSPTPGFTGDDALTFEEITFNGVHEVFRLAITVK